MIINANNRAMARAQGRVAQLNNGSLEYPAVLGNGQGDITVPGSDHIYYVRTVLSQNTDGTTEYDTPEPAFGSGASMKEESGFGVIIGYDRGWAVILRADSLEMIRRNQNPGILNPHNPYNKFFHMRNADIGLTERVGTGTTNTMEVMIKPFYYKDDADNYQVSGNIQFDFTSDIPAADGDGNDRHLIAGLFVDNTNTIVSVTSTAKVIDETLSHATDLVEVFDNAPPRGVPIRAFRLYTGQTLVEDADTFSDIRGWLNTPRRKNNFIAAIAPTVDDDIDLNYEVGSTWYDVTNDKVYVCLDSTDGAAIWRQMSAEGYSTIVNIDDTDSPYSPGPESNIIADTTGGDITINLPAVATSDERQYTIKNVGTGTVTIDPAGVETIDGSTTLIVNVQYDAPKIICDGTEWWIT